MSALIQIDRVRYYDLSTRMRLIPNSQQWCRGRIPQTK